MEWKKICDFEIGNGIISDGRTINSIDTRQRRKSSKEHIGGIEIYMLTPIGVITPVMFHCVTWTCMAMFVCGFEIKCHPALSQYMTICQPMTMY